MWFKSFLLAGAGGLFTAAISLTPAQAQSDGPVVVAMGDSLMAGYEMAADASFPAQLEANLRAQGINARVINAGVSGDTSTGGLARLDWALSAANNGNPDLVIVEFGANDALRGIEPAVTRGNLDTLLSRLQGMDLDVLLLGMRAPPNMGSEYEAEFNAIFPDLAAIYGVAFYPFFLDGVALDPALKLADGMHPNRAGVAVMVDNIAPMVKDILAN